MFDSDGPTSARHPSAHRRGARSEATGSETTQPDATHTEAASPAAGASRTERVVLGIDPGLSRCGYGAVVREGARFRAVRYGVLRTDPKRALPSRLAELEADLEALVAEIEPGAVAVERVLFQVNARTAISVGQASGLALAVAARAGVPVVQYSPNEVKLAVTGDGAADKAAVQLMVTRLLSLTRVPQPPDAADALALAMCHAWRARVDGEVPTTDPSVPTRLQAAIGAALAKERQ